MKKEYTLVIVLRELDVFLDKLSEVVEILEFPNVCIADEVVLLSTK